MPPVIWLACLIYGSIGAYFAKRRNKNPFFWFAVCFMLGLGALIAFILHPYIKKRFSKSEKKPEPITPTLPLFPPDTIWYYLDSEDTQQGPVSFQRLQNLKEDQTINTETYVWNETFDIWKQWKNVLPS